MLLTIALIVLAAPPAPVAQKVATTRPAATRPAYSRPARPDDSFVDKPLSPEEKQQYMADIAKNRQQKLAGLDTTKQKVRVELAKARTQAAQARQQQIKAMKDAEGRRDRRRAAEQRSGNFDGTQGYLSVDDIQANKRGIKGVGTTLATREDRLAADNDHLTAIENCWNACLDTATHAKYEQLRKAVITARRARTEHDRAEAIDGGEFVSDLQLLSQALEQQYRQLPDLDPAQPAEAQPAAPKTGQSADIPPNPFRVPFGRQPR